MAETEIEIAMQSSSQSASNSAWELTTLNPARGLSSDTAMVEHVLDARSFGGQASANTSWPPRTIAYYEKVLLGGKIRTQQQ